MGLRARRAIGASVAICLATLAAPPVRAQTTLSPDDARTIEYGKEIFKTKATCQFCHKWDASGDQGYGGNALSLRKTQLTPAQMAEVIKCGRPGTGMPYHDRFAYTDKRCYGMTAADLGDQMPDRSQVTLQRDEIDALADYVATKIKGLGKVTQQQCYDYYGPGTVTCDIYAPKSQ